MSTSMKPRTPFILSAFAALFLMASPEAKSHGNEPDASLRSIGVPPYGSPGHAKFINDIQKGGFNYASQEYMKSPDSQLGTETNVKLGCNFMTGTC